MKNLALVAVGCALVLSACSTMDDVAVVHGCPASVRIITAHLQPGVAFVGGEAETAYRGKLWSETVPPDQVTRLAGIVNMGPDDLVRVSTDFDWERTLTRSELRDLDVPIELPPEACPPAD
ncbi:MAG: hypothetical protein HKN74_08825 [Acidimicrobiia bacterium]|nr:hypothetical protein [Acidimicrobiia bacterium]NNF10371.1 hypothetical protein [Acidimicrobiia bacterium]